VLDQAHRLRRPADFNATMRGGRRCASRLAVVYVAPAGQPVWRAGLVVSKAVGNSVVRHRVSRRLRAILAGAVPKLDEPKQVVVRALTPAAQASYGQLEQAVGKCLKEAAR
jgi:ribonuclease P protein component